MSGWSGGNWSYATTTAMTNLNSNNHKSSQSTATAITNFNSNNHNSTQSTATIDHSGGWALLQKVYITLFCSQTDKFKRDKSVNLESKFQDRQQHISRLEWSGGQCLWGGDQSFC